MLPGSSLDPAGNRRTRGMTAARGSRTGNRIRLTFSSGRQAHGRPMKDAIALAADALRATIVGISRDLHADPELSLEERRACALLAGKLEASGFAVEIGAAGLETAFLARLDGRA